MTTPLISILAIILLAAVGVTGDYFIKLSGSGQVYIIIKYFLIGMLIYAVSALGWFFVMKTTKISSLGIVYSVSTALLLFVIGVVYFKESYQPKDIIALIFGIISIILISK